MYNFWSTQMDKSRIMDEIMKTFGSPVDHPAPKHSKDKIDEFASGWNAAMRYVRKHPMPVPMPKKVIFHDPATIVYWDDGEKTIVKCQPGDTFSEEVGLTTAMLKRYMGNDNTFNRVIAICLEAAVYRSPAVLPASSRPTLPASKVDVQDSDFNSKEYADLPTRPEVSE